VLRAIAAEVDRIVLLERELTSLAGYFAVRVSPPPADADAAVATTVEVDVAEPACRGIVTLAITVALPLPYPERELVVDVRHCRGLRYGPGGVARGVRGQA
jgi:hypothetical protein